MISIKRFLFLVLALALTASTSSAQGIDLAWHDCITQPSAAQNVSYACDGGSEGVPYRLVVSFVSPANLEHFVAADVELNFRANVSQPVPDWWRIGVGECREGAMALDATLTGIGTGATGACRNPWLGSPIGGGYQWDDQGTSNGGGGFIPGWAKLKIAVARETETTLEAGQRYVAAVVTLDPRPLASAEESCSGCELPACLALHEVALYQSAGQVPPQYDGYYLRTVGIRLFVTWQGGSIGGNGCPLEAPVRNTTWGAIKANYR